MTGTSMHPFQDFNIVEDRSIGYKQEWTKFPLMINQ